MKINIDSRTWLWIGFIVCTIGATIIGTFGTWGASGLILLAFFILLAILS
jgi:hypothetical protein